MVKHKRRNSFWRRFGLVFPALTWLSVQVAMAGGLQVSSASGVLMELCSSFGNATVVIDLETGQPVEPAPHAGDCDWCNGFGNVLDVPERAMPGWHALALNFSHRLTLAPPPHVPLRLVGDAQSRAPPVL